MAPAEDPDTHVAPLSWRDVGRMVNESEVRIIAAIRESMDGLGKASVDHERRLRDIEATGGSWGRHYEAVSAVTHIEQGRRIGELETGLATTKGVTDAFINREKGILATFSAGQKVVLTVVGIVGGTASVLAIISFLADLVSKTNN
jgi:hypothetical protein